MLECNAIHLVEYALRMFLIDMMVRLAGKSEACWDGGGMRPHGHGDFTATVDFPGVQDQRHIG